MEEKVAPSEFMQLTRLTFCLMRNLLGVLSEPLRERFDVGVKELLVLRLVALGRQSPGSITDALKMPAPTVSRILNRLASAGLLTRTLDANDHRRFQLSLTTAGGKLLEEARELISEVQARTYAHVPAAEIQQAIGVLEILVEKMDKETAELLST